MIVLDIFTHTGVEIPFSSSTKNTRIKLCSVFFSVSLTIAFLLFHKNTRSMLYGVSVKDLLFITKRFTFHHEISPRNFTTKDLLFNTKITVKFTLNVALPKSLFF